MPAPTHAEAYAVLASREQGRWQVEVLPEVVTGDLDALVAAVRQQPQERDAVALVDVADEFFVAVRVQGGHVRLLLSDVTASAEWDLATQVVDDLDVDVPSDDALQHVVPAGDLRIFDDLGVDEHELAALLSDTEAYADELLGALAHRLGFANAYERVVDALVR